MAAPLAVSNSEFQLTAKNPGNCHWLRVQVQKVGDASFQEQMIPCPENDSLPDLDLSEGPGNYIVHVLSSPSPSYLAADFTLVKSYQVDNKDTVDHAFLAASLDIQSDNSEIQNQATTITASVAKDLKRAKAIHNWMTENVTYDESALLNNNIGRLPIDALSVLHSKLAICLGYANLTAALHRAIGIKAKVVVGKLIGEAQDGMTTEAICNSNLGDHAWNEVWVDDRWVVIDTTLDSGSEDGTTGQFVRTPDNDEFFDPDPGYFALTHAKCSEELQ